MKLVLARKGDDCLIRTAPVRKAFIDSVVIFNTAGDAGGHNHSASLPAYFSFGNDLFMKMIYHHSRFLGNGIAVAFHKAAQLLLCPLLIEHRVILDGLHQLIEAVDRRVVLQHIQNESFLDRLLHRINMEGSMLDIVAVLIRNAEGFQRFILRGCGKRKVAGIVQQFAPFHHGVDFILVVHFVIGSKSGKRKVHLRRVSSALSGMSFIDDDGEMVILVFCSNLRNNVRELLNRGHDNTLSIGNGFREIAGAFCPCDRVADLHELLDRIPNLLVENPAVGDYDNGIQHRATVLFKPNQLMSKPSDRVGFAAACAVLNKILFSDTICFHIGKQPRYNIELMVAGENLFFLFLLGILVHLDDDLRVVFYDQRQFFLGENILPKIIGHKTVWIRRVTCSIIISLVKGQKPTVFPCKLRAELDAGIVYGKMHHATFELE